ncbi:MAG: cytochrome b/b6 domain-containing protein [Caulobacteraceae bacterium]|nr:cytochrome b/b6 domain-containing protein [Caulobacteraceae bacterium]
MQWINSKSGYGWLSIALHWLAAIAVIVMLVTGFQAAFAGDAGDRAARSALMGLHISVGASVALLLLARVLSNYGQPRPAPPEQAPVLKFLSSATHQVLLLAILVQVISGPLAVWSGGRAVNVFGLFFLGSLSPHAIKPSTNSRNCCTPLGGGRSLARFRFMSWVR